MLTKFCKVDLRLPPLLGMLIVGIALKNVPYNFGQFGRAECDQYNHTAEFVDSVHDLDAESDKISFRKRSAGKFFEDIQISATIATVLIISNLFSQIFMNRKPTMNLTKLFITSISDQHRRLLKLIIKMTVLTMKTTNAIHVILDTIWILQFHEL